MSEVCFGVQLLMREWGRHCKAVTQWLHLGGTFCTVIIELMEFKGEELGSYSRFSSSISSPN